jgi:molybdopterin-binding protein
MREMPTYRLGKAAKMLGVSSDTVRRMVDDGRLRAVRSSGGQRMIDGASLALSAKPRKVKAPEVVVAQSARNRFPGIVTRVIKDRVAAQVEIQAGPHRFVSLLTREAVDELGLKPGVPAVAVVKATNVGVELPRG